MSSASDLSCHHQSGCFALADDQTEGLLSKICHHQNPLQLPKCLFPSSASCKHFISNLRHPILSAPAFPEGGINPLAHRYTQQTVTFGQFSGISGCSMPMHLCLVGLEEAASTTPSGWSLVSSLRQQAAMAMLSLSDSSGCVTTPVCHVRNLMYSRKPSQQMSDGLCKLGLDFTSGNGDRVASPQLGLRQRWDVSPSLLIPLSVMGMKQSWAEELVRALALTRLHALGCRY